MLPIHRYGGKSMKTIALTILIAAAIVLASANLNAQGATAAISGTVLDPTGAAIAGASITVSAPDPSFVPGMDPYDAHWLARLLHGQAYLVQFSEYSSPPEGRASRSTRCASLAIARRDAWASPSRQRRGVAAHT